MTSRMIPKTPRALFFSVILSLALPFSAAAQTADEVVHKALAARGGIDKIKALQGQRITGSISFGPGAEGSFTIELKRPLKMHTEISIQGQTIVRVYDGRSAGWVVNPFTETKNVQPMAASDLRSISDEADFDGPFIDYRAKGNQIELVGKENVEEEPAFRIKLTKKNGDIRFYLFDAASFLLVKWEGKRPGRDKEIPVETFYHDFREIDGLLFPFEIESHSPAAEDQDLPEEQQKIVIDKIELNPQIDDSHFAKPSAPAPAATSTLRVPRKIPGLHAPCFFSGNRDCAVHENDKDPKSHT